jgi:hypothetical protein
MVGLHRAGRRVLCCIRERRIVEDKGCRSNSGGDDECLDAEAPPEVLDGIPFVVSFEVSLIPRQSERCVGHLDHEEVEISTSAQKQTDDSRPIGSIPPPGPLSRGRAKSPD